MTTIQQYFDYSTLSSAAYGTNLTAGIDNTASLKAAGMVQSQIDQFIASGWDVVDQSNDALYGSSSFSATLFHNTQTNEYVFANRGTFEPWDFAVDGWGITALGLAASQVIDMYRYYKQLITPAGQSVSYSSAELETLYELGKYYAPLSYSGIAQIYNLTSTDVGLGKILASQTFATTGHSLGGHLSLWLNALIPSNVDHVYTYNGAGQGNLLKSAVTAIIGAVAGTPITFTPDSDVTNLYGYGGPTIIAGVGGAVGQNIPINIEFKSPIDGVDYYKLYNHSITQLTDAIAVANLLSKLDSNITTSQYNQIFDKSSNVVGTSLEGVLDGLRKYFGQSDTTPNDNRTQFYDNLYALQNFATFKSLIGKVTLVDSPKSAEEARSDLCLFLSLYYLTPFALKTDGSIAADSQLTIANSDVATQFKDDKLLTAEQIANGEANFSDMYLNDRVSMLSWVNKLNTLDIKTSVINPYITDAAPQHFKDVTSDKEIFINGLVEEYRDFVFGSSNNDMITGHNKNDHLYGMGGNDTINGGNGNDYIEGNAGQDTLHGDAGNDRLLGGRDVDILDGGAGNDQLKGGEGVDVYQFTSTYGTDVITDSDGQGFIMIDSNPMNSATKKLENIYKNDATGYIVTRLNGGTSLVLSKEGDPNRIIINDWSESKNLSISLTGDAPKSPAGNVMNGDFKKAIDDKGTTSESDDTFIMTDDGANNYTIDEQNPHEDGALDLITGTAGADVINGLGGSDALFGLGGDDWIEGGDSGDVLEGGLGKDTLIGGAGDDYIYGSSTGSTFKPIDTEFIPPTNSYANAQGSGFNWTSGYNASDVYANGTPIGYLADTIARGRLAGDDGNSIDGGTGNDLIAAGTGADYVHGGADKDRIFGMDKDDILFGDGGNDVIYGDGNLQSVTSVVWTLLANHGNDIIDGGSGEDILYGQGGNDIIFGCEDNDEIWGDDPLYYLEASGDDFLYGGAGDDQLAGGKGSDNLEGGSGSDNIYGGEGNDRLIGGIDADNLYGGAGNDILIGSGDDNMQGGADDDTYFAQAGDNVSDIEGHSTIYIANTRKVFEPTSTSSATSSTGTAGSAVSTSASSMTATPALTISSDSITLNIALDNSETFSLQAALYGMDATLQFADGEAVDIETLVSTELTDSVSLFLSSVIVGSGAIVDHAFGGKGNDQIVGDVANDTIKGYGGNDTLLGGDGHDVIIGGDGNDHVQGDAGDDVLDGGDGSDGLLGLDGNDSLHGGAGVDELQGNAGNDVLDGGTDNDTLYGQEGNDTLDGGAGNDVLQGNAGDDVYLFSLGGGHDVVWEEGDTSGDVLRFGADIVASDIIVYQSGADLVLSHNNGLDQVTIANWYVSPDFQLKQFEFSDGTVWDGVYTSYLGSLRGTVGDDVIYGTSKNETLYGMDGNDILYGNGGQDTFSGGAGNDELNGNYGADVLLGDAGDDRLIGNGGADLFVGGKGNDDITGSYGASNTYVFSLGDGADSINTIDSFSRDTLSFGADIRSTDISAERVGDDLILRHQNGSDSVNISNWYLWNSNYSYKLAFVTFVADGVTWDIPTLSAMGNNHNYTFNIGDGAKTIEDWSGTDTLTISNLISEADIVISRIGQNLRLAHVNGLDTVTITDWFNSSNVQIETITFSANGTTLTNDQITQNYLTLTGTNGNDVIYGGDLYGETILGMAGNDTLYGGNGDDQITGGTGNDILYGGYGNDTYYFNQGDGQDMITDGDGKVIFGQGLLASLSVSGGGSQDAVYSFGNGSDRLTVKAGSNLQLNFTSNGTAQAETITGSAYNDNLYGLGGNDTIVGGAGKDELYGGDGDDVLDGYALTGTTDDQRYGSDIGDVYVGGKGNDTLNGNTKDDTYYFNLGDGNDVISEGYYQLNGVWQSSNYDRLIFGENITPESIQFSKLVSDLVVKVSASDSMTIKNWFSDSRSWVDSFQFANGRTLYGRDVTPLALIVHGTNGNDVITGEAMWANTIYGEAGDDSISGGDSGDTLHGGLGNDYLAGGWGNDVYYFERGGGHDQILNAGGWDSIRFDASISASDIDLSRNGSSLIMSLIGTNDTLEILNYFSERLIFNWYNSSNEISYSYNDATFENLTFSDGSSISRSSIQAMFRNINGSENDDLITGTNLANVIYGNAGNDVLYGYEGDDVLYGGAGNDYLDAGAGTNILFGGGGDDTLVGAYANGGDGNDTYMYAGTYLGVFDTGGNNDQIKYTYNPSLWNLVFRRENGDLRIGGYDGVVIYNHFTSSMFAVERLTFADGSSIGLRDIQSGFGEVLNGTSEDSILIGASSYNDTLNGGGGNDYLYGGDSNDILNGGSGNDVYFVGSLKGVVTELVNEGIDTVVSDISYTLGANVENLTFTWSSEALNGTGNELDNVFRGNDVANIFAGGLGNDTYYVDARDTVTENTNAGTDTVYTDATYTLGTNVENGVLTDVAAVNLTGNAANNILTGNIAANILSGGAGSDTMIGGQGDDTYILDVATDNVIENLNEGSDTVQVGYATTTATTLTTGVGQFSNVENITVTGTGAYNLTGNTGDNTLIGNASTNVLTGNAGNDVLNGMGGADTMTGGLGHDIYTVDMLTDSVNENQNEGIDLVNIAIATKGGTYALGNHIENATIISTVAYNVTGNALDNVIVGNSAANSLTGGAGNDTLDGAAGVDTMAGGTGDDVYIVDDKRDVLNEVAGAGNDTVKSAITYTLGSTSNLENLILTGTTAVNATGNAMANYMMGNSANNTLTDTAGGNDILQGLAGVDTFNDTSGNNLFDGGVGNDIVTAGAGRDLIIGGLGNDTITTGTGYDVIVFNKGDGQDTINASTGADNTISLGGNFAYSDLSLTKSTNNLILKVGATDQITLKDWYLGTTNKSVVNLQVIAEAMTGFALGGTDGLRNNKIESFNFANLVAAFDSAGATANWQLTDARLTTHLQTGSDTAAIGGDLAYQYGKNSNLTGMGLLNAQSVISAANFGQTAQTLNNPSVWQAELVKLS